METVTVQQQNNLHTHLMKSSCQECGVSYSFPLLNAPHQVGI